VKYQEGDKVSWRELPNRDILRGRVDTAKVVEGKTVYTVQPLHGGEVDEPLVVQEEWIIDDEQAVMENMVAGYDKPRRRPG
jgi:hypothetical protein